MIDNPSVEKWLSRVQSISTKETYGQALQQFCEAVGYPPERLLDLRVGEGDAYAALGLRRPKQANQDPNGYAILDLIQSFLLSGKVTVIQGKPREPKPTVMNVAEYSAKRKALFYATVKSYFAHNRAELPRDPTFKITEPKRTTTKEKIIDLDSARRIINACKQPYHMLLSAALYGGLGVSEMALLNELWPTIKEQLGEKKDPIKLDYSRRKNNPMPYFTLVPARLFKEFEEFKENPFLNPRGNLVTERNIETTFAFARKRVSIKKQFTPHMLRDLFRTSFWKVGKRKETPEFLMGHSVDQNGYLQLTTAPEEVIEEWKLYENYLDKGIPAVTKEELDSVRKELYTEKLMRMQRQKADLEEELKKGKKFKGTVWVMQEDGTFKGIDSHEELIQEVGRFKKDMAELSEKMKELG